MGTWSREQGANFTFIPAAREGLFNATLIVTSILVRPLKIPCFFVSGLVAFSRKPRI